MKRLSVRLSIVGAVLALGAAAIAHSILSGGGEVPDKEEKAVDVVQADETADKDPPSPIRVDRDTQTATSPALQPPPSSLFARSGDSRPVNHLSSDAEQEPTKSASAIPTNDPVASSGGFPIGATNDGAGNDLPTAVADTSSGDASAAPPPAPSYGADATVPEVSETADSLADRPGSDVGDGQMTASSTYPSSPSNNPSTPNPATSSFPTGALTGGAAESDVTPAPGIHGLGAPLSEGESVGSTTNPALAGATPSNSFPAPGDVGDTNRFGPPAGAAPPAGAGVAAGGALTGEFTGTTANPAAARDTNPPAVDDYPSTAANTNPVAQPGGGYGAAPAVPASNMSPDASAAFSPSGYGNNLAQRGLPPAAAPYSAVPTAAGVADAQGTSTAVGVSNLPGDRRLEGQQAPSILIEKSAPEEIQVNRKATFQVRVRNNGNAPAHNVVVVDRVPNGTQFLDATPPVTPTADGTLVWQVNAVNPGEEIVLSMNVLPRVAGEIGSVAQATFQAQASVRTVCTQPELKLNVTAAEQVLIGQPASIEITVTNTGNGAAESVVLEADVPEGFKHAAGPALEHKIGLLRPQESRRLTLVLDSAKPGTFQHRLTVRGEGELFVEDVRPIQITTPLIQVAMQGPSLRYLDRQATYIVQLANAGTAAARNVELVTHLPKGMKYVTSDNHGQYDTQSHAVFWSLEELPADKQGDVHVTVLPIEPGNLKLTTVVRADLGLNETCEHEVVVEGLAELSFVVSDVADPIEVGSDTTYEIKVRNRGSKADADIQLVAQLPPGITPKSGDGPTQGTVQGQNVVFAPLTRLGPNEDAVFKIHAQGTATGDHVIRAQLRSTELRVPVTKEESTRVYTDN